MLYKEDDGHIIIHNEVVCDGTYYFMYECFLKCVAEARAVVQIPEYSDYFYMNSKIVSQEAKKEDVPEDRNWCTWFFSVDMTLSNIESERPPQKEYDESVVDDSCQEAEYQKVEYIDTRILRNLCC